MRLRWVHATDGAFTARRVDISLDDRRVFQSKDEPALEQEVAPLVDLEIEPGNHQLRTQVHVTGGGYGVFAYMNDYKKDLEQVQSFNAVTGTARCFSLLVSYGDNISEPIEERPKSVIIEQRRR